MDCVFCKIVSGEIPSKTYYEDENCLVTLDIQPGTVGHTLIIPKKHVMLLNDEPELAAHMFSLASKVSKILLKVTRGDGTTTLLRAGAAAGQRLPHASLHVIPRKTGDALLSHESVHVDTDTRNMFANKISENPLHAQQTLDQATEHIEQTVEEMSGETEPKEDSTPEKESTAEEEPTPEEDSAPKEESKPEEDSTPKEDSASEEESAPEKESDEVDLDEIAGLFK